MHLLFIYFLILTSKYSTTNWIATEASDNDLEDTEASDNELENIAIGNPNGEETFSDKPDSMDSNDDNELFNQRYVFT
jgi:hypothetical protein